MNSWLSDYLTEAYRSLSIQFKQIDTRLDCLIETQENDQNSLTDAPISILRPYMNRCLIYLESKLVFLNSKLDSFDLEDLKLLKQGGKPSFKDLPLLEDFFNLVNTVVSSPSQFDAHNPVLVSVDTFLKQKEPLNHSE